MKAPPWITILFICEAFATNQTRGARASYRFWYKPAPFVTPVALMAPTARYQQGSDPGAFFCRCIRVRRWSSAWPVQGSTTGRLIEGTPCAMGGGC